MTSIGIGNKGVKSVVKIRTIKGISVELEKIAIPENVRIEANRIFIDRKLSARKGNKMNHVLFYCIYKAYKNMNKCQAPKKIATLVGIPSNEINKAISIDKSMGPMNSDIETDDFIPFTGLIAGYCEDLGIDEFTTEAIKSFGEDLRERYPILDEKFPQNIAAGLIYYYLTIHAGEQDKKAFSTKVQLSEVTINTAVKIITNYHNS